MQQDCFKEYLKYIFKHYAVQETIFKGHLVRFLDLDYVRVIYAHISHSERIGILKLKYIFEILEQTKRVKPKAILSTENYELYLKLTEIHG